MRLPVMLLCATAFSAAVPAYAADALKFGPPPPWVVPQPVPTNVKQTDAPVAVLLTDEQIALDPGKVTTYRDGILKIQTPQGLAAGNISLEWDPATETLTVNKLNIIRDGKVIDVLASGQTFTTLRRETNLDAATLDGTLTATIQPEGLQQGDELEIATTRERSDPVLKGHVQTNFAEWNDIRIESGHAKLSWPEAMKVSLKEWPSLPEAHKTIRDGRTVIELSGTGMDPIVPPSGAPLRFKIGRVGEASDFASWDQVAQLMLPLYQKAAAIPASGPLHDEVEKIRSATSDPKIRAAQALALVQDRVRYVALLMGQGGYIPASAETTWSRRFGDCKAKSTLLLAILHSLGVEAEPVLVEADSGDVVADELPMLDAFNHVMVRAHVAGKTYWLDGTREGDSSLDGIQVPDFGWVLPLTANATLVHLVPPPLEQPSQERHVDVNASEGLYAPAAVSIKEIYRGDRAVSLNNDYSAASVEQRDNWMREEGKGFFDTFTVKSSSIQFDKPSRTLTISIDGTAKINWKDSWAYVPTSTIAFDADFERPAGPNQTVPFSVSHPRFAKDVVSLRLPHGVAAEEKISAPVHETLAGVEYERSEAVSGDTITVESSERSVAPEVAYKDALAAEPKLRALFKDDVYLKVPDSYYATAKDLPALAEQTPTSADEYVDRGNAFLNHSLNDKAIADYTAALKLEPDNEWALADRGLAYVWKHQFDDAAKDFDAADKIQAGNVVALRGRALMAEFKHDCAQAMDFYTQSLAKEHNTFALSHRARCEAELSKFDAALADSAEVLKDDPYDTDLRVLRANILLRRGDHEGVAAEAEAMIRTDPESDSALVAAANSYAAIGQRDKAMQLFDRALAIKPTALLYISRVAARPADDSAGRMADVDAALKLEPGNLDASALKAELLSRQGKYADALAVIDQLPKPELEKRWVRTERAILLHKAGKEQDAEKEFVSLALQAKTATDYNDLCWTEATHDIALESALQECQTAVKMNPESGPILDSLGMAFLKLGRLDEALDAYNRAIAKETGADSLMGRAFVYARKGDQAHADADAAAARKIAPEIDEIFANYGLKFDQSPARTAAAKAGTKAAPADTPVAKKVASASGTRR